MQQPNRVLQPPARERAQKALFDAIRKGDLKAIAQAIDAGADPNVREVVPTKPSRRNRNGPDTEEVDTPLMVALDCGFAQIQDATQREALREKVVRLLIEKGAEVNRPGPYGFTPLIEAARGRLLRIVLLFLQRGAKPDVQNAHGDTALVFALNEEQTEIVDALLRSGANVNGPPGSKADTPLMNAVVFEETSGVKLLLERGADPNIRRRGWNALELAIINDDGSEIVQLLRRAGARGRSREELKPEVERRKRRMDEDFRKEEADRLAQAERLRKLRPPTTEDNRVVKVALLDLFRVRELRAGARDNPKQSEVVLFDITAPGPGMIEDDQVNSELTVEQARAITLEMRDDLWLRNAKRFNVSGMRFQDSRIRVLSPPGENEGGLFWFEKHYPNARLHATIFLPGYNRAHDRAVLRYWFGPAEHGAVGTSFLVRRGNDWQVAWRKLSYFV